LSDIQKNIKDWSSKYPKGNSADITQSRRDVEKHIKKHFYTVDEKSRTVSLTLAGLNLVFNNLGRLKLSPRV
jgi:hypothetical protein